MRRSLRIFGILAALGVAACVRYEIRQVDVYPVESYARHVAADGVVFAIDVYDTPERCEAAFDEDLTSKNYVAVHLLFRSTATERLLIARDTIVLADPRGGELRPVKALVMAQDFADGGAALAMLDSSVPGYQGPDEANQRRETDWYDREIPENLVIRPGYRANGFVYFRLPEGRSAAGMVLRLAAERIGVGRITTLELTI